MNVPQETVIRLVFAIAHLGTLGALWLLYHLLGRSSVTSFGVTVAPEFRQTAEGRKIIRRYQLEVAAWSVAAMGFVVLMMLPWTRDWVKPFLYTTAIIVQTVGQMHSYFVARRAVLPFAVQPSLVRRASLQATSGSGVSMIASLVPLLMLVAASLVVVSYWDRVPEWLPTHWGLDGTIDHWEKRSVATVFLVPTIGAVLCLLMSGMQVGFSRWGRSTTGGATAPNTARIIRVSLLTSQYLIAVDFACITLLPILPIKAFWPLTGMTAFSFLTIIGLLVWIARQLIASQSLQQQTVGDGTSDASWKWGIFYINSNDAAVLVPRRFGIGYTVNLANPRSLFVLVLMLMPIVLIVVSKKLIP